MRQLIRELARMWPRRCFNSVSYIYKALIRRRITGEVTARRSGGGPKPKLALHDDALRERIAAEPDITLAELQAWLLAERKV